MLSNIELTERIEVLEHEVKILKRTIGMGNLELIPTADYELSADTDPHNSGSQICGFPGCKRCYPDVDPELSADTCPHLNWDRDYENDIRICKNCGHQEALY